MRRLFFVVVQILFLVSLQAQENNNTNKWILDRFNFYFEDDVYTKTDDGYSAGEKLSWLYFIEDEDYAVYDLFLLDLGKSYSYITFGISNQMFTPTDTQATELIEDDRPYAGWLYGEVGIHKSSNKHLRSLSLQIGVVGPSSGAEQIQNFVHEIIGSDIVNGWDNQLNNELGVNLKYTHKWLLSSRSHNGFNSSFAPFLSASLGNVLTNAVVGANMRVGYNIPKDFGVSSIDIGSDPGIPVYGEYVRMKEKDWSFSLNLQASASVVARDIFLDGNTFTESHSVEKESFVYYYAGGFTLRYKKFVFDFLETYNSKKFVLEKKGHGVGTLVMSWLY